MTAIRSVKEMVSATGFGLLAQCSSGINIGHDGFGVDFENEDIAETGKNKTAGFGHVSAKCQTVDVFARLEKDNHIVAQMPDTNWQYDRANEGWKGIKGMSSASYIKYRFAMWKHNVCVWREDSKKHKFMKCDSRKMCSCSSASIGGSNNANVWSMIARYMGKSVEDAKKRVFSMYESRDGKNDQSDKALEKGPYKIFSSSDGVLGRELCKAIPHEVAQLQRAACAMW